MRGGSRELTYPASPWIRVSKAALLAIAAVVAVICVANAYLLLTNRADGASTASHRPVEPTRAERAIAPGVRLLPDHDRRALPEFSR